jgi:hypothetical protein
MFQRGFESPKFWHFELGNSKKPFFKKFEENHSEVTLLTNYKIFYKGIREYSTTHAFAR